VRGHRQSRRCTAHTSHPLKASLARRRRRARRSVRALTPLPTLGRRSNQAATFTLSADRVRDPARAAAGRGAAFPDWWQWELEITAPAAVTVAQLNAVLAQQGIDALDAEESAPLAA
jgi:hypothetical protein